MFYKNYIVRKDPVMFISIMYVCHQLKTKLNLMLQCYMLRVFIKK